MYINPEDMEILHSNEVLEMEKAYFKKFGEYFIHFHYSDFHRDGEKPAAQVYKEALAKALQDDKPSTLKHELTPIELGYIEHEKRKKEIERAMESGEPIQLTARELLTIERSELGKIHRERFGFKMKLNVYLCKSPLLRNMNFDLWAREVIMEVLKQGKPYEINSLEEAKAWEQGMMDRLVREGKWPPQVPDGMVWDHEKIVKRLMEELGE